MQARYALLLLAWIAPLGAAEPTAPLLTVVAPSEALAPASAWPVDLVAFNPGTTTLYYQPPAQLTARVSLGGVQHRVRFHAAEAAKLVLPAGGFGLRRYVADQPPPGTGLAALEFAEGLPGVLRTALAVDASGTVESPASSAPPLRHLVNLSTAASTIERTFAGRFGLHEGIYFIYGPDAPAAKFQFSFKYRLLSFSDPTEGGFTHTLQAAFTQRSLWDVDATSSPFYDTSYMPELMLESLAPLPSGDDRGLTPLGLQLAFKHESNGRDGPNSRSLNSLVLRGAFVLGRLEQWHAILVPELHAYVSSLEDNPALEDYRGYGRLRVILERNNRRPSLAYALHGGRDFTHPTHQVDLTVPFRSRWLDFESALLIQYFNGYGESLLDYTAKSETVRAGLSLVR